MSDALFLLLGVASVALVVGFVVGGSVVLGVFTALSIGAVRAFLGADPSAVRWLLVRTMGSLFVVVFLATLALALIINVALKQ